jgi:hypothetical protein
MYVRWAFGDIRRTDAISGCLIVDDPLLKSRYGFLRFREALALMERHNFTTTLAFIPWNWRRTQGATVRLFKEGSERLSLSVHGCDHTAEEFGERSTAVLNQRVKTAVHRMEGLRHRTSLPYDAIMVFPQGVFSPEVGHVLKANGFWAAVNTEVAPLDESENRTTIADLWDVAIMKYGTLPIFTRRYLTQGIENFAFDGLLGKPCLIVAHHDGFRGRELVEFIDKLNALSWTLHWRTLGDVIKRSARIESRWEGRQIVQMCATAALVVNDSTKSSEFLFVKPESDPECVKTVMLNGNPTDWSYRAGNLHWSATIAAQCGADVRIEYADRLNLSWTENGAGFRLKTAFRRYMSEFRDNYLSLISSAWN